MIWTVLSSVPFFKEIRILLRNKLLLGTYLSPGRSLTLAVISAASGTSFSTSSRGPQKDLFCPRKVFFAKATKTK
jgi:hypothetical protein